MTEALLRADSVLWRLPGLRLRPTPRLLVGRWDVVETRAAAKRGRRRRRLLS